MKIWGAIASGLGKRGAAVLISIHDAKGSTPRETGTRMVVFADGAYSGTIGGGTLEWRAIAEAQRLLSKRARSGGIADHSDIGHASDPRPSPLGLAGDDKRGGAGHAVCFTNPTLTTAYSERSYALGPELGQCCGGHVALAFELIDPLEIDPIRHFARNEAHGPFTVTTHIEEDRMTRQVVPVSEDIDAPGLIEHFGDHVRTLMLFGAGHVGRALVLALAPLPFRVIWVDSRPDAFPSVVPGNVTMICPPDPLETLANPDEGSFALIMTHSHELDLALCDATLRSPKFAYVGVIGSATKRARFERRLIAGGVAPDRVSELVCPIGAVGLKSKLPQVIAAATAVELLVKDEICLRVSTSSSIAPVSSAKVATAGTGSTGRGQTGGR